MTHEEMAAELTRAGWRVQSPLTQENCKHERKNAQGMICSDGSSFTEWTCQDCFKTGRWESPALNKLKGHAVDKHTQDHGQAAG